MADEQLRALAARAIDRIAELERELASRSGSAAEPVAIVGMSCRYPGAPDISTFWRLLQAGDCTTGFATNAHWSRSALDSFSLGDMDIRSALQGGFLDDPVLFDPEFFGLSPREAEAMDPQQRLFLELVWEAIEDTGVALADLPKSRTATYLGISGIDYALEMARTRPGRPDPYLTTGNAHSVASGRSAYTWGFGGAAVSIDTACSSSAVAIHVARLSLLAGDCDLALAGGVNRLLAPQVSVQLASAKMLSPTGRCHAFSADADGYARAEGGGVVVLKRLADAVRDGDRIHACLLGSAVNQDGRTSGITVPNGRAQEEVIRAALRAARVTAAAVGYIEAHGTGTRLGDPIELRALQRVFTGGDREVGPVLVGSVKSNIGHAEAAAGVAGVIKAALAVAHAVKPPLSSPTIPTPEVSWDDTALRLATQLEAWPGNERIAGVSSFGFSGTNAHLVIGSSPPASTQVDTVSAQPRRAVLIPISGRTRSALAQNARRYAEFMTTTSEDLEGIAWTASVGRTHFAHRRALVARTKDEARSSLAALADAESVRKNGIDFLFTDTLLPVAPDVELDACLDASRIDARAVADFVLSSLWFSDAQSQGIQSAERDPLRSILAQVWVADYLNKLGAKPNRVGGKGRGALAARLFVTAADQRRHVAQSILQSGELDRTFSAVAAKNVLGEAHGWTHAFSDKHNTQLGDEPPALIDFGALDAVVHPDAPREFALHSLAAAYEAGATIDWRNVFHRSDLARSIPTYCFDRRPVVHREQATREGMAPTTSSTDKAKIARLRPIGAVALSSVASQGQLVGQARKGRSAVLFHGGAAGSGPGSVRTSRNLLDLVALARAATGPGAAPLVATVAESSCPSRAAALIVGLSRTLHVEHASQLSCVLHEDQMDPGLIADQVIALVKQSPIWLVDGGALRREVAQAPMSPPPAAGDYWRGRKVLIVGALPAADGLQARLTQAGAEVWREKWGVPDPPSAPCDGIYLFLPRYLDRQLSSRLSDAQIVAQFEGLADALDSTLAALPASANFICLSRGAESALGWRGRLMDCALGDYAWRQMGGRADRCVALDWPLQYAGIETSEEIARLAKHGVLPVSPSQTVELLLAAPNLSGRYLVDNFAGGAGETSDWVELADLSRTLPFQALEPDVPEGPFDPRAVVAKVLNMDAAAIAEDALLGDIGMDSLMALEIQEAVELSLGRELDIREILDHASIRWLSDRCREVSDTP